MALFKFSKIITTKSTVVFTWNSNSIYHHQVVVPEFIERNYVCTFFVNPGESDFHNFSEGYLCAANRGFEIGSHGHTHCHLSEISEIQYLSQLQLSQKAIKKLIQKPPTTFAFPYNDCTPKMLAVARQYYFETKNALINSIQFELKTKTTVDEISTVVKNITKGQTLVFSGHSVVSENENPIKNFLEYQPLYYSQLCAFLDIVKESNYCTQVCTFEQAALKNYLLNYCNHDEFSVQINSAQLNKLNSLGISEERIMELI